VQNLCKVNMIKDFHGEKEPVEAQSVDVNETYKLDLKAAMAMAGAMDEKNKDVVTIIRVADYESVYPKRKRRTKTILLIAAFALLFTIIFVLTGVIIHMHMELAHSSTNSVGAAAGKGVPSPSLMYPSWTSVAIPPDIKTKIPPPLSGSAIPTPAGVPPVTIIASPSPV
jgi:hypothetical protein